MPVSAGEAARIAQALAEAEDESAPVLGRSWPRASQAGSRPERQDEEWKSASCALTVAMLSMQHRAMLKAVLAEQQANVAVSSHAR